MDHGISAGVMVSLPVPVSRYALFFASAFFKGTREGLPLAPGSEAADLSDERDRAEVLGWRELCIIPTIAIA
jgi:hypothetical protein